MIDFFVKDGPLMWPILLCSLIALALVFAKSFQFYSSNKRLSASLETVLAQKPAEVAELIEGVRSGAEREQLALIGTRQVRELEKGLGVLALIASIAPLLWRVPLLGIDLPPAAAKVIDAYALRLFKRDGFRLSLTEAEREMRQLSG